MNSFRFIHLTTFDDFLCENFSLHSIPISGLYFDFFLLVFDSIRAVLFPGLHVMLLLKSIEDETEALSACLIPCESELSPPFLSLFIRLNRSRSK